MKALLNHYDGRPVVVNTRLDGEHLARILQGYVDWLWGLTEALPAGFKLSEDREEPLLQTTSTREDWPG